MLLVPALALLLGGCAVTSADGQRLRPGSDAFADYVERVFREQNAVAGDLMLELDSADPDSEQYIGLEAAELSIIRACRGLNELAVRQRDGEPLGGPGALQRARQAPECERAADEVATILQGLP